LVSKKNNISKKVHEFYNQNPFPDFDINKYTSCEDLKDRATWFYKLLDLYIPIDKNIIDAGCGTGQFTCFLAIKGRKVLGVDFSEKSLKKADFLKDKLDIPAVRFLKKDLLDSDLHKESFDYTFCCGVLHHTPDPYLGFKNLVKITKPGGFIIIGLYNRYGRVLHKFRQFLIRRIIKSKQTTKNSFIKKQLVVLENDHQKIDSWYADQYINPYESTHTIGEIFKWFQKNGISYINSFPPIELFKSISNAKFTRFKPNPFLKIKSSNFQLCGFSNLLKQLGWIITMNNAGGYFIVIGKKQGKR